MCHIFFISRHLQEHNQICQNRTNNGCKEFQPQDEKWSTSCYESVLVLLGYQVEAGQNTFVHPRPTANRLRQSVSLQISKYCA
jgi:hypothetical protein